MATLNQVPKSNVASDRFEAFIHEGRPFGEVHWLRTESGGDGMLFAGLWTHEPATFEYIFPGDETFHVLEGTVQITLAGGETVSLGPGDIVSFNKGQASTWNITRKLKKFFVISG